VAYLNATGGIPSCGEIPSPVCTGALTEAQAGSFSDVVASDPNAPYIEVLKRRGYTKGCALTGDLTLQFCPTQNLSRAAMAAFIIRAKMNNVFPTTLSGVQILGAQPPAYGDNWTLFQPATAYFSDEPTTDAFFNYIQKLRELRITNGTTATTFTPSANITRQEVATMIIRAFFL